MCGINYIYFRLFMNKSVFAIAIIATNIVTFSVTKMFVGKSTVASQGAEENKYLPLVHAYYDAINTPPSENTPQMLASIVSNEWIALPPLSGGNGIDGIVRTLGTRYNTVPNIKINVQEVLPSGEDRLIVRTVITGTPNGQFMGVNAMQGKTFEINAIDVHTIKDGKLAELQHVEDWSTAIKQVGAGEQPNNQPNSDLAPTLLPANMEAPQPEQPNVMQNITK